MQTIDLLISSSWMLPVRPENIVLKDHAIAIDKGRILAVLPIIDAEQKFDAKTRQHLEEQVLMPGLINAHTHTPMNIYRGFAEDLPLMTWLNDYIWPAERLCISPESVEVGSTLAIAEMLRSGTTCFNDSYMFPMSTAKVADKAGIRALIGMQMMNVETKWAMDAQDAIQKCKAILDNRPDYALINYSVSPQGPYTMDDQSFIDARDMAAKYDLPIHLHLHETEAEIEGSIAEFNMRPLERINRLGLLDQHMIAPHMVHLTEDEIQLAATKNIHVAHIPECNMKLSSGIAPIHALKQAGVNVCIGTDGAASNNDLDMLSEMKTAALLAKVDSHSPTTLTCEEIIEMATINAAKALGFENEVGSLEAGKAADITAIDLSSYLTQPVYHPMSAVIYSASRMQVSNVWVAGKQLLQDGELTTVDVEAALEDLKPWQKKIEGLLK